ncbi:unnamed protein product [Rhizophagus irregularis]|nr:unnamed protein product [Rhizophagus irregularis]
MFNVTKNLCLLFLFSLLYPFILLAFLFIICILWIPSVGLFILAKVMGTFKTNVKCYKLFSPQWQYVIARMSKNFRWPYSMPEYLRRSAFNSITKVGSKSDEKFDLEVGLNLLFFYNALDKVDQTKLPRSPPARMVTVRRVNNGDDYKLKFKSGKNIPVIRWKMPLSAMTLQTN